MPWKSRHNYRPCRNHTLTSWAHPYWYWCDRHAVPAGVATSFRSHGNHTGRQATGTHLELILLGPCILGPSEGPPTATETTGQANQPQPTHCLQCEKAMARMLLSRWNKRGPFTVAFHNEISLLPLRSTHAPSGAKSALVTPPCGRQSRNVWQSVLHKYA